MRRRSVLWATFLIVAMVIYCLTLAQFSGRPLSASAALSRSIGASSSEVLALSSSAANSVYLSYEDAEPVLTALKEILPSDLKSNGHLTLSDAWPDWIARRDAEIRDRLIRGEEDSLVNFLLFGSSYTRQPRMTAKELAPFAQNGNSTPSGAPTEAISLPGSILRARMDDLVRALVAPRSNERLLFLRRLVEQRGYSTRAGAERARLKEYILANLVRVMKEQGAFAKELEGARLVGDPTEEFARRSRLFRTRGLSLDTSLLPNFAVEESLKAIETRGLLVAGSVHRVAIVGPGLDFTDKTGGYDFYPQQTLQPFGLIDTLARLRLARADSLEVTTLDLSQRVNHHLAGAVERARHGEGYLIQLPRSPEAKWNTEALNYWEEFGDQIGVPARPIRVPSIAGELKVRAVVIRPSIGSRIRPLDLNIVLQHLELPAAERFDLIVATNVFVYYDVFEQALAMVNVERMLRPGGFILSNNALLELPSSRLHSVGYLTTVYSDRPDDGDHIVWYRRSPD